jgi:hypothetical protein
MYTTEVRSNPYILRYQEVAQYPVDETTAIKVKKQKRQPHREGVERSDRSKSVCLLLFLLFITIVLSMSVAYGGPFHHRNNWNNASVRCTFEQDITTVDTVLFIQQIVNQTAIALGITMSQVTVTQIYSGSLIADIQLSSLDPNSLAQSLIRQAAQNDSALWSMDVYQTLRAPIVLISNSTSVVV